MKVLVVLALAGLNIFKVLASNGAMEKHGVVPDVIGKSPPGMEVEYTGGVKVNQGNELTPTQVKNPPSLKWPVEDNSYYLLAMVDPDAPSRKEPKFREWHHWLVGNIPGMDIKKGDVLSEYVGAGPPEGTGLHRYVILIYRQPGKTQFGEERLTNKSGKGRGKFSIKNFSEKYKLGEPIAANFFQAQFDSYVPQLYKQLAG